MKKWLVNILIGIDQLANACCGGDPDETISSRLGKTKVKYGGRIPWSHPIRKVVDFLLEKIDPNHSIDAVEVDEGKDAIIASTENTSSDAASRQV
jgi:hypothetical protein